jgi:phospholipase C
MNISRRQFVQWSLLSLLTACAGQANSPTPSGMTEVATAAATPTGTPNPDPTQTPSVTPSTVPTVTPTPTVAPTATTTATPIPTPAPVVNPIQHVVIFVQENHSFDSLFNGYPGVDAVAHGGICSDTPEDPPHSHVASLMPNGVLGALGACHYSPNTFPNYWRLAQAFTLCDHFFAEARGPSEPNYFFLTAAQSPIVESLGATQVFDLPALPNRLMEKGLTWADYGGIMNRYQSLRRRPEITSNQARIITDAQNGKLANVSWLFSGFDLSGHPPASMCTAENWMVRVLNALMRGPQWGSTVVFVTWDEWGGFYDHVNPPVLERESFGTPVRVGQRVACTVVSPYAKAGYVSHQQHSHISLLKFCETLFALKPLTEREAQVDDMMDCFDFGQKPLAGLQLTERKCG